jgi:hypothetical protein
VFSDSWPSSAWISVALAPSSARPVAKTWRRAWVTAGRDPVAEAIGPVDEHALVGCRPALGWRPVRFGGVDDSPEIYENMAKALAIVTAWNESGDGDLSLVEQTTMGYLHSHPDPDARKESFNH